MALPNIYDASVVEQLIQRINKLNNTTSPQWGKMNVAQMLAHCNVTYDLAFERKTSKNSFIMKWILKTFIKKKVVGEQSYPPNSPTAPVFIVADQREFDTEKATLIQNIKDVQQKGASYFEGRDSDSFGPLTAIEWNNMFYKHLQHHLNQFGV
jgi:hypothetical protein